MFIGTIHRPKGGFERIETFSDRPSTLGDDPSSKSEGKDDRFNEGPLAHPFRMPGGGKNPSSSPAGRLPVPESVRSPLNEGVCGGVSAHQVSGNEPWRHRLSVRFANDNFSTLADGVLRSDDGPTNLLALTLEGVKQKSDYRLQLQHEMLTERGWGVGTLRTDRLSLRLGMGERNPLQGEHLFGQRRLGFEVGLDFMGDAGGATLQDQWHGLWEGTALGGRRLHAKGGEASLQGEYTKSGGALVVGGSYQLENEWEGGRFGVGAEISMAVGNAGVHSAFVKVDLELGQEHGIYGRYRLRLGYQEAFGDALAFDGAPLDGFIGQHEAAIGYRTRGGLDYTVSFTSNTSGTQEGFGNRDGHQIGFSFGYCF